VILLSTSFPNIAKKNVTQSLNRLLTGPESASDSGFQTFRQSAHEGVKVVSPKHRQP